jgi:putative selenium metabolism hydrolase
MNKLTPENTSLLRFAQDLVRIPSFSGQEEQAARRTAAEMEALGYDEVTIDRWGSVLGRIGSGGPSILFDSHTDTVKVLDAEAWQVPPFSGAIVDGFLWGRGSVDMKSGLAASVHAAAAARRRGLLHGRTVYVTATVCEESCDGESLKNLLAERSLCPDCAVICEPSANLIAVGHKGKAQVVIQTRGVSAHGAAPEKGVNAVYEMAEIIRRVEQTNQALMRPGGRTGTLALTRISSAGVSVNAVPAECEVYLDRRMVVGETEAAIRAEMEGLVAGKNASWQLGTLHQPTWTRAELTYAPLHQAWEISLDHPLSQACLSAYQDTFQQAPAGYEYWDFSTNAVAIVAQGIPTIGFGPGEHKLAHMNDEKCAVQQILAACEFYTHLIGRIQGGAG